MESGMRTLDPNVDVILRLLCFPGVFVGFGEGVCRIARVSLVNRESAQHDRIFTDKS